MQSAQALRAQVEEARIPAVLRSERVPEELRGNLEITASLPDSGDLVVLRAEGPADQQGLAVILALGAVLGAMLAVFAAFGAEFVRRAAMAAGRG